ncbi:MAG TPA: APC family permease [Symbiobacteriaceae bacterium]|nr:APC family permease [Symbiobacteriaceae bacterium]
MSSPSHLLVNRFKRIVFGSPKRTDQAHHERLGIPIALAVFSADGLSSVAYATEEILLILTAVTAAAAVYSLPIGLAIVALIMIVAASYNQTIRAYPTGGGSYIVSKENLGKLPGLVAGAALLIDYVMTVAVSAAAGIAALVAAIPALQGYEVPLCLAAIWFVAWMNLRGVKESGSIFALPTYGFVLMVFVMLAFGLYRVMTGDWHPHASVLAGFGGGDPAFYEATKGITWFLILRAFASGCTALSGLEAVSNGVQAFKAPEDKNAIKTLSVARTLLFTMFAGITVLAYGFNVIPHDGETVMSLIAAEAFGGRGFLYFLVQAFTTGILLLATNTAYADFPRLSSLIARDGFLPRRFANRGDSLVFHWGIYILAGIASLLIVLFNGSTHHLIPLYAVGVFTAFTLSQTGMVVHWLKEAKAKSESVLKHWWSLSLNALGAFICAVITIVVAVAKFTQGAWIILIVLPLFIGYMLHVHSYYDRFKNKVEALLKEHLTMDDARRVKVILTIGGLTPVIDHAMRVAHRISKDVTAVYVAVEPEIGEKVARKWDKARHSGTELVVVPSPYREVVAPLKEYLEQMHRQEPHTLINLLVPVIVTNEPFDDYLHNGYADQILRELRFSEGIIITEIPFYVNMNPDATKIVIDPAQ